LVFQYLIPAQLPPAVNVTKTICVGVVVACFGGCPCPIWIAHIVLLCPVRAIGFVCGVAKVNRCSWPVWCPALPAPHNLRNDPSALSDPLRASL